MQYLTGEANASLPLDRKEKNIRKNACFILDLFWGFVSVEKCLNINNRERSFQWESGVFVSFRALVPATGGDRATFHFLRYRKIDRQKTQKRVELTTICWSLSSTCRVMVDFFPSLSVVVCTHLFPSKLISDCENNHRAYPQHAPRAYFHVTSIDGFFAEFDARCKIVRRCIDGTLRSQRPFIAILVDDDVRSVLGRRFTNRFIDTEFLHEFIKMFAIHLSSCKQPVLHSALYQISTVLTYSHVPFNPSIPWLAILFE